MGNLFRKSKDTNPFKDKATSKKTSEHDTNETQGDIFNDPFSRKQSELDIDLSDI